MSPVPVVPDGQLITRVEVGGVELELDDVIASAVMRFGRVDPADGPVSSTLTLTLVGDALELELEAGDALELDIIDAEPRFRGYVTDVAIAFEPDPAIMLTAAGSLAYISRRKIGNADWPQEALSVRVARVFADADWSDYTLELGADPLVAARTASETTLLAELTNLALTATAAVIDLPDGSILFQSLDARVLLAEPILELPPALVAWAPAWSQSLDVVNVVDVGYGTIIDPHTETSRNTDSVTRFGERVASIASTFALEADAAAAGAAIVNRRGYPHWIAPVVDVTGMVTPRVGALVLLSGLPAGSPLGDVWQPVVEGWVDVLEGDEWRTTVQLSDPIRSGVSLRWIDVPPSLTWAAVDPDCSWAEASVISALVGSTMFAWLEVPA